MAKKVLRFIPEYRCGTARRRNQAREKDEFDFA